MPASRPSRKAAVAARETIVLDSSSEDGSDQEVSRPSGSQRKRGQKDASEQEEENEYMLYRMLKRKGKRAVRGEDEEDADAMDVDHLPAGSTRQRMVCVEIPVRIPSANAPSFNKVSPSTSSRKSSVTKASANIQLAPIFRRQGTAASATKAKTQAKLPFKAPAKSHAKAAASSSKRKAMVSSDQEDFKMISDDSDEPAFKASSSKKTAANPPSKRMKKKVESDEESFRMDSEDEMMIEASEEMDILESSADGASFREESLLSVAESEDEGSNMEIDGKPKAKKRAPARKATAAGGLTAAARKKGLAAAADAGALPPMNDLSEMFKDMITRTPSTTDGSGSATASCAADDESDEDAAGPKKLKQAKLSFGAAASKKSSGPKAGLTVEDGIVGEFPRPKGAYLAELVQRLGGRKLRVATMCSGTESPLLALGMISRQMKIAYGVPFDVEHVFSAEIEPYKQAYIERNFAPPILFRDVTELGKDKATTAYGALVDVPGNVDLLVAGTSCVDYSNLNNSKKGIEQQGESGNTFRGMLSWVTKHRPRIVVLENVCSAPWGKVAEHFENVGYSAAPCKFDTKDFYIPHTRTRGYLVAFRNPDSTKKSKSQINAELPEKWVEMVKSMERPASSPLEAFLLPPNDPRLHQGRLELAASKAMGKARAPTDWGRCASRHEKCRFEEGLGTKRPWTDWRDGAICNFPEGYWNDWANSQTERVQDLIDVSHLRTARQGTDAAYRTLVWNLSQNVDREIGSAKRPGIVPCMTPTMIPYVTNRGGPLIGIEALALQGIPADELLLTRETEDQLADLAGNAMSSTVVGVCMVAALILGTDLFDESAKDIAEAEMAEAEVVDAAISAVGRRVEAHIVGQDRLKANPLNLSVSERIPTQQVLQDAARSARFCICEGPTSTSTAATLLCSACGHTRCADCSIKPQHVYEPHPLSGSRIEAREFAKTLKSVLPMRLAVVGFDRQSLEARREKSDATVSSSDWQLWSNAVVKGLNDVEFHFKGLDRKHHWIANFDSPGAYLRLSLHEKKAVWLLFVKAPASDSANSQRRKLLKQPIARLEISPESADFMSGVWSILLPSSQEIKITVKGAGEKIPAWESRVGITQIPFNDENGKSVDKVDWQKKQQWNRLEITADAEASKALDVDIDGIYDLHHGCGTAMEALHIRKAALGQPRVSFFLDPVRVGFAPDDPFVFALDHERLDYDVERVTIATMDAKWRPTDFSGEKHVTAHVRGSWEAMPKVSLEAIEEAVFVASHAAATYAVPPEQLTVQMDEDSCKSANAVLVCKVALPHAEAEQLWTSVRNIWGEIELQHKGKQAFDALAWITERLPSLTTLEQWTDVEMPHLAHDAETCCQRCAPVAPELSWMLKENRLVPVEDVVQAGEYERALKRRPAPIVAQLRLDGNVGSLQIGLNVATLLHRALSRLPTIGRDQSPVLSWKLRTDHQAVETQFFRPKKLTLTSNRQDAEAAQPPSFSKFLLRPEQRRSLTWMLAQERPAESFAFVEEEIAEATLPALGWRAEGRASRPVMVRGGVLADEVGYGKTAITLALIDASRNMPALDIPRPKSRLRSKATLIVVPPHLTLQWEGEIDKFLGQSKDEYKVVRLTTLTIVNAVTIEDIMDADIVIVALTIFKSPLYWTNLAGFAASGHLPAGEQATRHFTARLKEVLVGLDTQVDRLQDDEEGPRSVSKAIHEALDRTAEERKKARETKDAFVLAFGKKRLTGAAYLAMQEDAVDQNGKLKNQKAKASAKAAPERESGDPWKLKSKGVRNEWRLMQSPPLHMFDFERVVIDEFTYVDNRSHSAVTSLLSKSTWVLSGTPPVSDFAAVKGIADFLHVHLGVDDDTEGSAEVVKKRTKGQTAVEAFHSFRETHTASWHEARYAVAQRFLDTFVRQNVAEIDEIPCTQHVVSITLPAAEHAIYLELDHHINSLQGINKKVMKSAKGARADRQLRLSDALGSSSDPREALIKRCAHFEMEAEGDIQNAGVACQKIVETREGQVLLCEDDLQYTLGEAVALYLHIKDVKKGYSDAKQGTQERKSSHFMEYLKTTYGEAGNGDDDATKQHKQLIVDLGITWSSKNADMTVDKARHQAAQKHRKPREDDESSKIDPKMKVEELKWQLREKSHVLRRLATELVSRTRSLRYFKAVRDVQRKGPTEAIKPCLKCEGASGAELCILSACGHTGCYECLSPLAISGYECPHEGCRVNLEMHQVIRASTLGREEQSGRYGAKLLQLVALIRAIPANERILVFVQFDDLLDKIRSALRDAHVRTIVIEGTATKQSAALEKFQNLDVNDPRSERVLILNVAASSASGANLTLANHVIFVHPVHYPEAGNARFIATETQAIGRIRRYGQKKGCHVYRLLTRNSVDEAIMEERTGSKPVGTYTVQGLDKVLEEMAAKKKDSDSTEEEPAPKARVRAAAAAGGARKQKFVARDSEEDTAEESDVAMESEEEKPKKKALAKGKGKPAPKRAKTSHEPADEEDDDIIMLSDDSAEPKKAAAKKASASAKRAVLDSDDDVTTTKKQSSSRASGKAPAKRVVESDDDDEVEEVRPTTPKKVATPAKVPLRETPKQPSATPKVATPKPSTPKGSTSKHGTPKVATPASKRGTPKRAAGEAGSLKRKAGSAFISDESDGGWD